MTTCSVRAGLLHLDALDQAEVAHLDDLPARPQRARRLRPSAPSPPRRAAPATPSMRCCVEVGVARVERDRDATCSPVGSGVTTARPSSGPSSRRSAPGAELGAAALDRAPIAASWASHGPCAADDLDRAARRRARSPSTNSWRPERGVDQRHALGGELRLGLGGHHAGAELRRRPTDPSTARSRSTRPRHWSRSWQQRRFISSLAVA